MLPTMPVDIQTHPAPHPFTSLPHLPHEPLLPGSTPLQPGSKAYQAAAENHLMHWQNHHNALRLALGSILTPKRPYTPSSRSSSGTSSPALTHPDIPHDHAHAQHHVPSRLGISRTNSTDSGAGSLHSSGPHTPEPGSPPLGAYGAVPAIAQASDGASGGRGGRSGAGTPRVTFIETLSGKSAWDALIHGSFS